MRISRLYEQTAEFKSRCKAFDFAVVAHAVLKVAVDTKKALGAMLKGFLSSFRDKKQDVQRKPHQLVLELNGLAQIPMFR